MKPGRLGDFTYRAGQVLVLLAIYDAVFLHNLSQPRDMAGMGFLFMVAGLVAYTETAHWLAKQTVVGLARLTVWIQRKWGVRLE